MKIRLKTDLNGDFRVVEVKAGITLEELCAEFKNELLYDIYIAKVNNQYKSLTYRLEDVSCEDDGDAPADLTAPEAAGSEDCGSDHGTAVSDAETIPGSELTSVELLDIRTQFAWNVYQEGLSMVFITAVNQVLARKRIEIANSLNQGLYTEIDGMHPVPENVIKQIRARMEELILRDLPFVREEKPRAQLLEELEGMGGVDSTIALIKQMTQAETLYSYSLDGHTQLSYEVMVPSTGYIRCFEIRRYKSGILLRFPNMYSAAMLPPYINQRNLYNEFSNQTEWDQIVGVNYVADLNEKVEDGSYKELILISEALKEKRISDIADLITASGSRIILIAGPSSSGKTTFARRLAVQLRVNGLHSLCLSTDDYFVERDQTPLDENGKVNYEGFDVLDRDLFCNNMNDLLEGRVVDLPEFDFINGTKIFGRRPTRIGDNDLIIIEGIHGLNEKLTEKIPHREKYKIYISPLTQLNVDEHHRVPTTDERLLRRLVRDYQFRGRSAAQTLDQWPLVRVGEDKNIFPYSDEADVLFNSYHVYEIAVLKKYAEPLLEEVTADNPAYAEAQRILDFLKFFKTIEDDSVIVNNSIIREFIGGSIFV